MYSQKISLPYARFYKLIFIIIIQLASPHSSFAFDPGFPCLDTEKICTQGAATKIIDGVKIYKDCWEYSFQKTCDVPSKDDCKTLKNCYEVALKNCLQKDKLENCVNQQKEFSCQEQISSDIVSTNIRQKVKGDEARELICKADIPCIDGNCIDQSYDVDSSMMSSISELYSVSKMQALGNPNFKIFSGFSQHCSKKPASYLNCCKKKGWGSNLGAKCTPDEQKLQELRAANQCIYVGKKKIGKEPLHISKHYFCCFGSLFTKVFQSEAKKQLGIGFGSPGFPDCRGLTLEEILKLDFEKIDFSEFISEIHSKMKLPNRGDISSRITNSMPSIRKKKGGDSNKIDKRSGVNINLEQALESEDDYGK